MPSDRPQSLFRSLSSAASREIYPKIKFNAEKHFRAAELLAAAQDYSNAIAHLILGSEELVKYILLVLQGYDFPVKKINDYDKLFTRHYARHSLLKEFYSVCLFLSGIINWPGKSPTKQSAGYNILKTIMHSIATINDSVQNHAWWGAADQLKQNCFYLDYTSEGIADPAIVDAVAYEQAHQLTTRFRDDLIVMAGFIEQANPKELTCLREAFTDAEINVQIDESITRKRKF